jgi:hypothetical protein
MINGVKTIGSLAAIGFLLALQPLAAQENFPEFDDLAASNVGLLLEGFVYPGGTMQAGDGQPTCNGTEVAGVSWHGSGVIIDPDGTMLTNWHVAGRAVRGRAKFHNGASYDVRYVKAYHQFHDLATLQISANQAFSSVSLGDSDTVRPLDKVLAVGNPGGQGINVTEGGVSQIIQDDYMKPLLVRHTAPITGGNSGGALYRGSEVIGINVSTWRGTGFHQAVPINLAKELLQFTEPVLLENAFSPQRALSPNDLVHLESVTGSLEPEGSAAAIKFLPGLTDYVFVVTTAEDADVNLLIADSQNGLFGCSASPSLGTEVLVKTVDYPQEVRILIINATDQYVPAVLDIYRVNW